MAQDSQVYDADDNSRHEPFGSSIKNSPPSIDYEEVMGSDQGVAKWMRLIVTSQLPVSPQLVKG